MPCELPSKPVTHSDPSAANTSPAGAFGEFTRETATAGVVVFKAAAVISSTAPFPPLATHRLLEASNAIPTRELKSALVIVCTGAMVRVPADAARIVAAL